MLLPSVTSADWTRCDFYDLRAHTYTLLPETPGRRITSFVFLNPLIIFSMQIYKDHSGVSHNCKATGTQVQFMRSQQNYFVAIEWKFGFYFLKQIVINALALLCLFEENVLVYLIYLYSFYNFDWLKLKNVAKFTLKVFYFSLSQQWKFCCWNKKKSNQFDFFLFRQQKPFVKKVTK